MDDHDDDPQLKREWPVQLGREIVFEGHGLLWFEEIDGQLKIQVRYRGEVYRRKSLSLDSDPPSAS